MDKSIKESIEKLYGAFRGQDPKEQFFQEYLKAQGLNDIGMDVSEENGLRRAFLAGIDKGRELSDS